MSLLAAIRPDDWNIALFVHVLGAMALVGALALAAMALAGGDRRLGFRALLYGVIPGWIAMRGGGQWIASKEGLDEGDLPSWVDIGFLISDTGLVLILIATAYAWLAARRRPGEALRRMALVLVAILLVASVVAVWAMSTKPS